MSVLTIRCANGLPLARNVRRRLDMRTDKRKKPGKKRDEKLGEIVGSGGAGLFI